MFNLFNKKSFDGISTAISMMLPKVGRSDISHDNITLANCYKKWVYACVSRNADAVSAIPLELMSLSAYNNKFIKRSINKSLKSYDKSLLSNIQYKLADNLDEVLSHPFLTLLENPNNLESGKQFIYQIVVNLEMFGDAYILIEQQGDLIVSLNCLHSQLMHPDIDYTNKKVKGYYYYNVGSGPMYILPENLCRINYYNPNNDYYGYSPLKSVMTPHELSLLYDDYNYAVLTNSGNPSAVISYQGKALTENERDKLETQWNKVMKGASSAGKVKVIGNDFKIEKLGMTPQEMSYESGQREVRLSVSNAFRVPLSLLDQKDSNRSSLDGAYYAWQKDKILPTIRLITDSFNKNILSRYKNDSLWLSYKNPVEADRKALVEEVILLKNNGLMTDEEATLMLAE